MEKKYHVGKDGNPAPCSATVRDCPVGGAHYTDKDQARQGYEAAMENPGYAPVNGSQLEPGDVVLTDGDELTVKDVSGGKVTFTDGYSEVLDSWYLTKDSAKVAPSAPQLTAEKDVKFSKASYGGGMECKVGDTRHGYYSKSGGKVYATFYPAGPNDDDLKVRKTFATADEAKNFLRDSVIKREAYAVKAAQIPDAGDSVRVGYGRKRDLSAGTLRKLSNKELASLYGSTDYDMVNNHHTEVGVYTTQMKKVRKEMAMRGGRPYMVSNYSSPDGSGSRREYTFEYDTTNIGQALRAEAEKLENRSV